MKILSILLLIFTIYYPVTTYAQSDQGVEDSQVPYDDNQYDDSSQGQDNQYDDSSQGQDNQYYEENQTPRRQRRYKRRVPRFQQDPFVILSLKVNFPITLSASTSNDISFLKNVSYGKTSGVGIGGGIFVDFIPIKYLDIELGFMLRSYFWGRSDIILREFNIPLIFKFRFPITKQFTFLIGAGGSYFHQYDGQLDPYGSGPGQDAFDISSQDLKDGFSFITKIEFQFRYRPFGVFSFEIGYERAKRSLNLVSNDLYFNLGFGFVLY